MAFFTKLLFYAGRKLAEHPEARARAAEAYRDKVRPAAEAAWDKAKPRIDATRDDIRRISAETPPRENPGRFAGRVARSLIDNARGRKPPGEG